MFEGQTGPERNGKRKIKSKASSWPGSDGKTLRKEISSEISLERWRLVAFEKGNMNRGLSLSLV